MAQDVFPNTMNTWIGERLNEGQPGRADVNHHVMLVYAEPLKVYFMGCSDRWLGEPDDIVQGFFEDRLKKPDFFDDWRSSGRRLRKWLITAFCYYLKEQRRRQRRDQHEAMPDEPEVVTGPPDEAIDRAFAVALVRRALDLAERSCISAGLHDHWQIFMRHCVQDQPYKAFAHEYNVEPHKAAAMARAPRERFVQAMRDVIKQDGVANERVEDEIQSLLEVIHT